MKDSQAKGLLPWTPDKEWRKRAYTPVKCKVGKETVLMAPMATMGAELLGLGEKEKEESKMPVGKFGFRTPDEIRLKILAEPVDARVSELAKK